VVRCQSDGGEAGSVAFRKLWLTDPVSELTPYLCVADARAAIAWYVDVLGAEVVYDPIEMPDGRIGHVELAVDGARWMMSDEFAEAGVAAPDPDRGSAVSMHLTVADVDTLAEALGAAGVGFDRGPEDSPPAGRVAVFRDPFGHRWFLNQSQ
jgi:PhnB protein